MKSEVTKLDYSGERISVGIDAHLKSWKISIALEELMQKTFSQAPDPESLSKYLHRHYPNGNYECVYEASYCGFWIQEELSRLGIDCKLIHSADVPTTNKEKCFKTEFIHKNCLCNLNDL